MSSDNEPFRAGFEAWARKEFPDGSLDGTSVEGKGWYYFDDVANDFWLCWKEAKRDASTEPGKAIAADECNAALRAAPASQHKAGTKVLTNNRILGLVAPFGHFATGDAQGEKTIAFARAIEREVAARFRAEGGNTSQEATADTVGAAALPDEAKDSALLDALDAWVARNQAEGHRWFTFGFTADGTAREQIATDLHEAVLAHTKGQTPS